MRFDGFDHLLRRQAETLGGAPALIRDRAGGTEVCSYRKLWETVRLRAGELRAGGKTCLGVLADGSLECVVELFAANLAGLQVVLLDGALPSDLLKDLLVYTDVDLLWGREELRAALAPALTGGVRDGGGKILFFTSGTTERAKAVVLTDRSLCASAWNGSAKLPLTPADTLLCLLPLSHVFGFVCGLLWGLSCGAAVALGRGARHYMDDCARFSPTAVSLVPSLLGFLLKMKAVNPELKTILVGAGDCPSALLEGARALGVRVSFGYGLTETSSGVAISVGGDPFAMEVCPDDTITLADDGELLIQAPTCMMEGYYKRPEDTAAVLRDGVLSTGDLGRFDEAGKLHILGRKKEVLVLSDGTKLFLPEYEGELAAALGTGELAVVLLEGRPALVLRGEGDGRAVLETLRETLARRPRGQQIARVLMVSEPLPRTATGKLKRWELQRKVEEA